MHQAHHGSPLPRSPLKNLRCRPSALQSPELLKSRVNTRRLLMPGKIRVKRLLNWMSFADSWGAESVVENPRATAHNHYGELSVRERVRYCPCATKQTLNRSFQIVWPPPLLPGGLRTPWEHDRRWRPRTCTTVKHTTGIVSLIEESSWRIDWRRMVCNLQRKSKSTRAAGVSSV